MRPIREQPRIVRLAVLASYLSAPFWLMIAISSMSMTDKGVVGLGLLVFWVLVLEVNERVQQFLKSTELPKR